MEGLGGPETWLGQKVHFDLQERIPPQQGRAGPNFDTVSGRLIDVGQFGATLETQPSPGLEHSTDFYPWNAIRRIRLIR
jgi:hypothetical protein